MKVLIIAGVCMWSLTSICLLSHYRGYHNNQPPHKHVLLNILYYQLSWHWTIASPLSAASVITTSVLDNNNGSTSALTCLQFHTRQTQMFSTVGLFSIISLTRFIANFYTDTYFNIDHLFWGNVINYSLTIIPVISVVLLNLNCSHELCYTECNNFVESHLKATIAVGVACVFLLKFLTAFLYQLGRFTCTNRFLLGLKSYFITSVSPENTGIKKKVRHNITFSSGVVTILIVTLGTFITLQIMNFYNLSFETSSVPHLYTLLLTLLCPAYWFMANEDLRDYLWRQLQNISY